MLLVNVLGTEYKIFSGNQFEFPKLKELDGYCDCATKTIVVCNEFDENLMNVENIDYYKRRVLRHEIIHAFMFESGLDTSCSRVESWASSDEVVDWFAIQSPKIFGIFEVLGLLENGTKQSNN